MSEDKKDEQQDIKTSILNINEPTTLRQKHSELLGELEYLFGILEELKKERVLSNEKDKLTEKYFGLHDGLLGQILRVKKISDEYLAILKTPDE